MAKHRINFKGAPPFKEDAWVELTANKKTLILTDHGDDCVDQELRIPLIQHEQGQILEGHFEDKAGEGCSDKRWSVWVVRTKKGNKDRLYGVHFETPDIGQSSGVWGADE